MNRSGNTARNKPRPGTKLLLVLLIVGGILLALKPSVEWIKGQLLHMEGAAHQDSLKEQNLLKWCADVLESENISQSDYADCEEFWKN